MFPKCISQIFLLMSLNVSWGCHPAVEQSDLSLVFPACVDTMSLLEHLLHYASAFHPGTSLKRENGSQRIEGEMSGTRTTVRGVGNTESG